MRKKQILAVLLSVCIVSGNAVPVYAVVEAAGTESIEAESKNEVEVIETEPGAAGMDSESTETEIETEEDVTEETSETKAYEVSGTNISLNYVVEEKGIVITGCNTDATGALEIPEMIENVSVVSIDDSAFMDCTSLTSITIPDTVWKIGASAFENCKKVTNITLSATLSDLGESAFQSCYKLTSIVLPDSLTYIPNETFCGCEILEKIVLPEKITYIGDKAFYCCYKLPSLVLPEGLVSIGENAFNSCGYKALYGYNFKNISFPSSLRSIGDGAFRLCTSLTKVSFPNGLETIGNSVFTSCTALTSVYIPDSVTEMGTDVFRSCTALKTARLSDNLLKVSKNTFQYCSALEEVNVPKNAVSIGENAYMSAVMTELVLPEGLESIESLAFGGCKNVISLKFPTTLRSIAAKAFTAGIFTEVTLYENIESIGSSAFGGCSTLNTINFKGNAPQFVDDSFKNITATVYYPAEDDSWTEAIGQNYGGTLTWVAVEKEETELAITKQPEDQSVKVGENADFTVEATGKDLTYQWQYSTSAGKYWTNSTMEGANTASLIVLATEKRNGQQYRCEITDGDGISVTSEAATLTIEEVVSSATIKKSPENQTAKVGDSATFAVEVEGENLTYQWQYSNNNGKYWYDSAQEGSHTASLIVTVTEKRNGQQYRCKVTDTEGISVVSEAVTLTVEEVVASAIVTKDPENQTAKVGDTVTFTVGVEGEGLTYQWQYSKTGNYWFNSGMEGSDTESLSVLVTEGRNGQQYRCKVTDVAGISIISEAGSLIVEEGAGLVITTQPENQTAVLGESATFTVVAEGEGVTYQWQYSNDDGKYWYNSTMTGATTQNLFVTALKKRDGQQYRCVIKDTNGNKVISELAVLNVNN